MPDRPVWDATRTMRGEWLTPSQVAEWMTKTLRPGKAYTRQAVDYLCQHNRLPYYTTPLGRLVHADDLLALVQSRLENRRDCATIDDQQ